MRLRNQALTTDGVGILVSPAACYVMGRERTFLRIPAKASGAGKRQTLSADGRNLSRGCRFLGVVFPKGQEYQSDAEQHHVQDMRNRFVQDR